MKDYDSQVAPVLARARQVGVDQCIAIGTTLTDSRKSIELCREHEGLYCTVGVHPHEAEQQKKDYLDELRKLAETEKVVAIGEIGLDYHYDFSPRKCQQRIFREQLDLANELALPVVIHCREAMKDCLTILDEKAPGKHVVFHCFSGDTDDARMVLDRGYFISFTGIITFRKSQAIQEVAQQVPLDKMLLETDCPYLSPEPKRNVRPNEPALLVHTAAKLAQLRQMSVEEIAQATTQNCRLFFGIE